jgi:phosphorylase kinase alpha/beta subunit
MIQESVRMLERLRSPSGLFVAAPSRRTGYARAWIRDNVYEALGFEAVGRHDDVVRTYRALLDVLLRHESKIDHAIKERPKHAYQYIHARYDPFTGSEFHDEWGNKQNDAIGALLFKIGALEASGIRILRDSVDKRIVQKLVNYLESIRYWVDQDNGMWEEAEDVHASSVGACVAGLIAISKVVEVKPALVERGQKALSKLLPYETRKGRIDLALLSLIYPYDIVSARQRQQILRLVESKLVRKMGLIRYRGDLYYHNGSGEAEWTFGFPWLAIIYAKAGNQRKHEEYRKKTEMVMNGRGELPELYYAGTGQHNENSPLGWAQALYLVMVNG